MRLERWIYTVPLRLRSLFRRARVEAELNEELRFHIEHKIQDEIGRGADPREARRRALLTLDGVERTKEECRDTRHTQVIDSLLKDVAYAVRTLRKSPVFALTAAATIALGIGASTAIFSVTNAVLLRPLPYPDADRLVLVFWGARHAESKNFLYSNADFVDLRAATKSIFEDMGGVASFRAFMPREDGSTEQISRALVTTNFFRLMGAKIALGRDFTDADAVAQPQQPAPLIPPGSTAILSYEYWQRRYGGNAGVLGREMASSGQRGPRIIGVLAPGFRLHFPPAARTEAAPDFWVANNVGYDTAHRNLLLVGAIGRLQSGLPLRQAQQQLDGIAPELRRSSYDPSSSNLRLVPMRQFLVEEVRPTILALMGAVMFLLLIACANVTNLLLVQSSLRERELAVRAALGGSRMRLFCQMLVEAGLLSALGTLLGVALAWLGVHALVGLAPARLPRIESAAIDWPVLSFAALAGLAATVVFGVAPALRATRPDLMRVLRGARTIGSGAGPRVRNSIVVAEVALSFVLLIGSGLMFRSFLTLRRVDPGFDSHHMLTFFVTREWPLMRQQGRVELLRQIQSRLRALPGVENATAALNLPLDGGSFLKWSVSASPAPASAAGADVQQVLPGYFETLRTPLLAGRTFNEDDNAPGRNHVIIDQLLATRAFPNESAVGKRILTPNLPVPSAEVIGVVAHQRLSSLADPGWETVYVADGFAGIGVSRNWMLRTTGDPASYAAAVRAEIGRIDRALVVSKFESMEALVEQNQSKTRFSLLLIGTFAVIAVLLAGVGLYGVLASAVRQRTAEIGVRMALGAAPGSIFRLVVGQGLLLSAVGILLGLAAAFALTRLIASLLVGVKPTDPLTFALMAGVFLAVAAAASWLPAHRAAGLDPTAALREE